ncbi:MAG: ribonuclease III [Kiritimatiellae bacterium]|nr:ribonuclease III [Kiritimatiellia bacterium]MCO5067562.1 ribonuclease III [Kiritimatiellia bacterium]
MILRSPYRALETALGYKFRRRHWLEQALTHPSYSHEHSDDIPDNQRLEFLGDAALGLVTAAVLYEANPDLAEGELTKMRSLLSSTKALAQMAQEVGLGPFLRLGHGEEISGGRERASILADALEAVIGAAYQDGDLKAVSRIFKKVFVPHIPTAEEGATMENPKGLLQEYAQRSGNGIPRYILTKEEGPAHQKSFTIEVYIKDELLGVGTGNTKRDAQVQAAVHALKKLTERP